MVVFLMYGSLLLTLIPTHSVEVAVVACVAIGWVMCFIIPTQVKVKAGVCVCLCACTVAC